MRKKSRREEIIYSYLIDELKKLDPLIESKLIYKDALEKEEWQKVYEKKLEYAKIDNYKHTTNVGNVQSSFNDNILQLIEQQGKYIKYLEKLINQFDIKQDHTYDEDKIITFIKFVMEDVIVKKEVAVKQIYKIAMFTPLTPLKNGIADYTEDILKEIKQYFDIDIIMDEGYDPNNPNIVNSFNIYSHKQFENRARDYDLIIYQVGNNPHHAYMVEYMLKYPGVIVEHDFILSYLRSFLSQELKVYCDDNCNSLKYQGNNDGNNPFNKYLIDRAKGMIVHSDYTRLGILEQNLEVPIKKIEHYAEMDEGEDKNFILRKKYGLGKEELIISSFGFVTYPKRIASALRAFAQVRKTFSEIQMRYIIVGSIEKDRQEEIDSIIRENHLEDYIITTGFADLEAFKEYIEVTDICINLRNPYAGETSGTLARVLGRGKACIVNDIGSFGELPDDICIKISMNEETELKEVYDAVCRLIVNQELRLQMGKKAKLYVTNELDIKKIGIEYRDFIISIMKNKNINKLDIIKRIASFIAYNYFEDINYVIDWVCENLSEELL